jgi:hypothetical protein
MTMQPVAKWRQIIDNTQGCVSLEWMGLVDESPTNVWTYEGEYSGQGWVGCSYIITVIYEGPCPSLPACPCDCSQGLVEWWWCAIDYDSGPGSVYSSGLGSPDPLYANWALDFDIPDQYYCIYKRYTNGYTPAAPSGAYCPGDH